MNMSSKSYIMLDWTAFLEIIYSKNILLKEIVQSVVRTQANYFIQKDCNSQLKGKMKRF